MIDAELRVKLLIANRPWEHEEQHSKEWVDADTGYVCTIWRHPTLGHLCGYVGIPKDHPCYGMDYNDMSDLVDVHGGLTYDGKDTDRGLKVFGFDAGHAGDFSPKLVLTMLGQGLESYVRMDINEVYRTWAYMEEQVLGLAKQLKQQSGELK